MACQALPLVALLALLQVEDAPEPPRLAFKLDQEIALGEGAVAAVTFHSVKFRASPGKPFEASVKVSCAPGKDHVITASFTLYDKAGETVATIKGRAKVDEDDSHSDFTFKSAGPASQRDIAAVQRFEHAFTAKPD